LLLAAVALLLAAVARRFLMPVASLADGALVCVYMDVLRWA
jgi:hypothetical protein